MYVEILNIKYISCDAPIKGLCKGCEAFETNDKKLCEALPYCRGIIWVKDSELIVKKEENE